MRAQGFRWLDVESFEGRVLPSFPMSMREPVVGPSATAFGDHELQRIALRPHDPEVRDVSTPDPIARERPERGEIRDRLEDRNPANNPRPSELAGSQIVTARAANLPSALRSATSQLLTVVANELGRTAPITTDSLLGAGSFHPEVGPFVGGSGVTVRELPKLFSGIVREFPNFAAIQTNGLPAQSPRLPGAVVPVGPQVAWEPDQTDAAIANNLDGASTDSVPGSGATEVPSTPGRLPVVQVPIGTQFITVNLPYLEPSEQTNDAPVQIAPRANLASETGPTPAPESDVQIGDGDISEADTGLALLPFHGVPLVGEWIADLAGIQTQCENLLTNLANLEASQSEDVATTESGIWMAGLAILTGGVAYGACVRPVRRAVPGTVPGLDSTLIRWNEKYHA